MFVWAEGLNCLCGLVAHYCMLLYGVCLFGLFACVCFVYVCLCGVFVMYCVLLSGLCLC